MTKKSPNDPITSRLSIKACIEYGNVSEKTSMARGLTDLMTTGSLFIMLLNPIAVNLNRNLEVSNTNWMIPPFNI